MSDTLTETGSLYSPLVGVIYVFNLIVGTGALTMPAAFAAAGWLVSSVAVVVLAFVSYVTTTFVIESMATANAVRKWNRVMGEDAGRATESSNRPRTPELNEVDERTSLLSSEVDYLHSINGESAEDDLFNITERIELGQMARMFFNKIGKTFFYLGICVYLYGDLAIYAAAVPKSLRDVVCTYRLNQTNHSDYDIVSNTTLTDHDPCWASGSSITRLNAYRIFLAVFIVLLGVFVFFNAQKTKYLQLFTSLMRWLAFSMMIVLGVIRLAKGQGQGHPPIANMSGVPNLFGVCVYSFMCHHSLPSLATPIKDKSRIFSLLAADYTLILAFYIVLSFTGIFCFSSPMDLYTLNFQPNAGGDHPITNIAFIQYFLALFPVFTLSTNFPIIGVSLRNNLMTLFLRENRPYPWAVRRLVFPLATVVPPLIIAMVTDNVQFLVGITGSFAGAGIQFFIPVGLAATSRKEHERMFGDTENKHRSPFHHRVWLVLVLLWAIICVVFVAVNHVLNWVHGKWD